MKLLITQHQSPGDILMLTSAVRDLRKFHPEIHVNCQTTAQELWNNNPYLDTTITRENADRVIEGHYPIIHQSNRIPYHFIHGFRLYLEAELGKLFGPGFRIPQGDFCCDVHLSNLEQAASLHTIIPDFPETPARLPIWLVDAGHKNDFTCKFWEFERFQTVVDATRDRIQWVQIGAENHVHRPLRNVVNLVGRTTHRQLIALMWHASGVLTPISYPMHLSTMPWKDHPGQHRPCVVIAGSREPSHWVAYPWHQFLHNCGLLPCARSGGCWKSRVYPLHDGSEQDRSLCLKPVVSRSGQKIPRCLDLITADRVIQTVLDCVKGFEKE